MTITRTTSTGKQEVLLTSGVFKTREIIQRDNLEIQYFDNIEGSKKVKELRNDCRIPAIKKSIILNYS
jgi:hypothetical protein